MKQCLLACVLAIGCGGGGVPTEITLSGATFGGNARVIVELWGYEAFIADAPATLIETATAPAGAVVTIETPENPHEVIDQGHGPVTADEALFYFRVFVDNDDNGELCPGDFREEGAAYTAYEVVPPEFTAFLTPITAGTPCF